MKLKKDDESLREDLDSIGIIISIIISNSYRIVLSNQTRVAGLSIRSLGASVFLLLF